LKQICASGKTRERVPNTADLAVGRARDVHTAVWRGANTLRGIERGRRGKSAVTGRTNEQPQEDGGAVVRI